MKYLIAISFLFFTTILYCSCYVFAQNEDNNLSGSLTEDSGNYNEPDTMQYRTNFIATADSIKRYKSDEKFAYVFYLDSILRKRKIPVETVSSESFRELNKGKRSQAQNPQAHSKSFDFFGNAFVRIILWILAFSFIGYILYKLFLSGGIFKKNPLKQSEVIQEDNDDTEPDASEYERLINNAEKNKNFRVAIRYLYLQTLQKLFESGLLQYTAGKTNYQYITELSQSGFKKEFSSLTLNYEYVWYGRFNVSEDVYFSINNRFKQFNQNI